MHPEDHEEDEGARSFTRVLEMIADGDFVLDASLDLHDLMRDLQAEARLRHSEVKGTFTLKLAFKVAPHGVVAVQPHITTKTAERRQPGGILWLTGGGKAIGNDSTVNRNG